VLPGETVPVDGTLLLGTSSFDESLLTGEASPVVRAPGDPVVAGSVNGEQAVVVRVTHELQASAISEIRRLVECGLEQRPRYARLAAQAARWFVAAVLLIAGATALFWLQADPAAWLANTIAVLIVTCPCALALATPVALAASAGRFVALGVLPLRLRALDSLALCDIVAFDKTGSLTAGRPALVALETTGSLDRDQSLEYAAALSTLSEHPLARTLRGIAPVSGLAIEQAENVPGAGIRAMIAGRPWRFGSAQFLPEATELDPAVRAAVERMAAEGHTVSLLSNAEGVQAVLTFSDPLRPGVQDMLADLGQTGVRQFAILSGDTQGSVSRLGRQLGIDDCRGRMSPENKLRWIREKQAAGHRVGMFGDGVNDAPVLAAADVSVSFSEATDLANASSDFLILGDDIRSLAAARRLARRTRANILQNLAWAAGYNLVAVPLAAAGWIPPWGAAIGMSLSSLLVVFNALRLQRSDCAAGQASLRHGEPASVTATDPSSSASPVSASLRVSRSDLAESRTL
jgi:Cu2+-exporting ATPase